MLLHSYMYLIEQSIFARSVWYKKIYSIKTATRFIIFNNFMALRQQSIEIATYVRM